MRKTVLGLVLASSLALGGCATLFHGGKINTPQLLSDVRWGLMEACSVEWVPADACKLGLDTLTVADGVAAHNPSQAGAAVKRLISDVMDKLPADSRLRPYLAVIVLVLQG